MASFVESSPTPPPVLAAPTPAPQLPLGNGLGNLGALFDGLGFTVIRIQSIVASVDWFQPFQRPRDSEFVGSGFAVALGDGEANADPVFVTNAHVVRDASTVQVQLPGIGQRFFDAFVPVICEDFDIAVVQLTEPRLFWEALREHNGTMQALQVKAEPLTLGLEVAAVGFPLGSPSLKLSRGVISGTEEVSGAMCYQSTAPISPGSSGGPLFALGAEGKLQVIGVNFASASSSRAQNTNYVVPTIHLLQVLDRFIAQRADQRALAAELVALQNATASAASSATANATATAASVLEQQLSSVHGLPGPPGHKTRPHEQFRMAPLDALSIEANEALYNSSGGCHSGVFLSRVLPTSAFRFASPPVEDRSFLTVVNGVELDSFGMGRTENFLGDPTPFESLMTLRDKVADLVEVQVCRHGNVTKHNVSMAWRPEYDSGIRSVEEPHFDPESMGFEVFAGVTLMQLTVNHVLSLLEEGAHETLGRWLLPENRFRKRLVVTYVEKGTYASRVLSPGMVVETVNGKNVSTLQDFQRYFKPDGDTWELVTDQGLVYAASFREALAKQLVEATSHSGMEYLLTPAFVDAARNYNLVPDGALAAVSTAEVARAVPEQVSSQGSTALVTTASGEAQEAVAFAAAAEKLATEAKAKALAIVAKGGGEAEDPRHVAEAGSRVRTLRATLLALRSGSERVAPRPVGGVAALGVEERSLF